MKGRTEVRFAKLVPQGSVRGRTTPSVAYGAYALALGALLAGVSLSGCGSGDAPGRAGGTPAAILARDRAAEFFIIEEWDKARASLAPLIEAKDAATEDLLRAAQLELAPSGVDLPRAKELVDRAAPNALADPVLEWCRYRLAMENYDFGAAALALEAVRRLAPDDLSSRLAQAVVQDELGQAVRAEELYREFLDLPHELTGSWRMTALYRFHGMLVQLGRAEEGEPFILEFQKFMEDDIKSPGVPHRQPGTLGVLRPHTPTAFDVETASLATHFVGRALAVPRGTRQVRPLRLRPGATQADLGKSRALKDQELWTWQPEALALVSFGEYGMSALPESDSDPTLAEPWTTESILDAVPFDLRNAGAAPSSEKPRNRGDDRMDFLVLIEKAGGGELRILERDEQGARIRGEVLLTTINRESPGRIRTVDFDHDGDLDLLCSFSNGARALRNDGIDEKTDESRWSEITESLPLPRGGALGFVEDLDSDNDVDLLFVGGDGSGLTLLDNRRASRFATAPERLPSSSGTHVVCADFNGDGRPDLATFGETLRIHLQAVAGRWIEPLEWTLSTRPTGLPVAADLDLDGTYDLLWPAAEVGVAGLLMPGFANGGVPFELSSAFEGPVGSAQNATIQVADLDGDHDQDVLYFAPGADGSEATARELLGAGGRRGLRLGLMGFKDNSVGCGAVVELREGLRYRRIFWTALDDLIAMGDAPEVDLVRVTWPNGTVQTHDNLKPGENYLFWQRLGLAGSCPFLYTWNGETYEFISDVLGITPLGLPMAPGMLVPPDHDEYVLVRGDQLVPRDGFFEMHVTEELREVTYLDRMRLDVVDHPAEIEIFPNERFSFPPFPEHHTHTVRGALSATRIRDGAGRDWTQELASNDKVLAAPFTPYRGQFMGLATPHVLELEFDPKELLGAEKLRLLMNGWLYWTDASVNVAAARHPTIEFVPPLLQVPDATVEGGWRTLPESLGFPAGKLKTMVVDVTDAIDPADPRLRIFSTLRLYWDSIRLAVDLDDAPHVVTSIEPASAELWHRGFSEPIATHGEFELEWFDWDVVAPAPRWNQHPGLYTRFGETLPLVSEVDDRFVVMGAGDALTVRFPADGLPPLPEGWTRDYLVFFDGWAKDRDPNTERALFVEPLPFHGMSGYPYGPDESFPDDELHRDWRTQWQTREAARHIVPMSEPAVLSARERERLHGRLAEPSASLGTR